MRRIVIGIFLLLISACQPAAPLPVAFARVGEEFLLAPGQSVQISSADLMLTLIGVPSDGRCPLDIECVESGSVTVEISAQFGSALPNELRFNTFTDNDGNVPEMDFEGMTTAFEQNGYHIQVKSILPFPQRSVDEIKAGEYRVTLIVTDGVE